MVRGQSTLVALIALSSTASGNVNATSSMAQGDDNVSNISNATPTENSSVAMNTTLETTIPTFTTTTATFTTSTLTTTTFTLPFSNCTFADTPETPWAWDPNCTEGQVGCRADNIHTECRFCGEEPYDPCPPCSFVNEPLVPFVWDSKCEPKEYTKGCFADGIHFECRFCGVDFGFDPCPSTTVTTTTVTTTTATTTFSSYLRSNYHRDKAGAQDDTQLGRGSWESASSHAGGLRLSDGMVSLAFIASLGYHALF